MVYMPWLKTLKVITRRYDFYFCNYLSFSLFGCIEPPPSPHDCTLNEFSRAKMKDGFVERYKSKAIGDSGNRDLPII